MVAGFKLVWSNARSKDLDEDKKKNDMNVKNVTKERDLIDRAK